MFAWLLFVFGRHVASLEVVDDLLPDFDVPGAERFGKIIEPDVSLVLFGVVALDAVLLKKRQRLRLRLSFRWDSEEY